jgi:hypothetical protein
VAIERLDVESEWSAWVAGAGVEGDFLQTAHWARIDKAANGRDAFALKAGDVGALVGRAKVAGAPLSCLHGPVFRTMELSLLSGLLAEIEGLARELGAPSVIVVGRPPRSSVATRTLAAVFGAAGYSEAPWRTSVVDLMRDDAELLRSFDRAVGKAVRRCERAGVSVRVCEGQSIERDFLASFAAATPGYDPRRDMAAYAVDAGRHYSYRVAVDASGTVLATLGSYRFDGVATEIMSSRTAAGRTCRLPVQDLLHWEAIRSHRDQGDAWFDLAGYAATPASPKEAGIRRFKLKWNGIETDSPIFSKVVASRWRRARDRARVRLS